MLPKKVSLPRLLFLLLCLAGLAVACAPVGPPPPTKTLTVKLNEKFYCWDPSTKAWRPFVITAEGNPPKVSTNLPPAQVVTAVDGQLWYVQDQDGQFFSIQKQGDGSFFIDTGTVETNPLIWVTKLEGLPPPGTATPPANNSTDPTS